MGVATAIAIGGLATSAFSTGMSFIQAGEQQRKQRAAEAAAQRAMDEAKKKLEINYTDEMAVKKEPYELQREAMLSQGAQAIQAGQESERGAVATAGKVQMAQNEAQAGIRTAMGQDMTNIQNKQIAEQSRLRDLGVQIDLGEVQGQQMAAKDAEEAAAAATAQGFERLTSTMQQGLNMIPFFAKGKGFNVTDFSPQGGQVTTSQRKGMVQGTTPEMSKIITNPISAQDNPSLQNNPWQFNPFEVWGDMSGVGGYRR
jgi:hypothetical protein